MFTRTIEAQLSNITKNSTPKIRECVMKTSEMASLSNSSLKPRTERPNRSTNNGDMDEKSKRLVKA